MASTGRGIKKLQDKSSPPLKEVKNE